MKKRQILLCLALSGTFLFSGCSKVDLTIEDEAEEVSQDNTQKNTEETEPVKEDAKDVADNATTDTSVETEDDDNESDNEGKEDNISIDYRVIAFYEEEIDSVPVSIVKTGAFDDGDVYSYDIVADSIADSYTDSDRLHIGTFLFKEDEIYLITDTNDDHDEQDFYDYGVLVYSKNDYSEEVSGYEITLHNDGYLCRCSYYDATVETGYYAEYVFNSDHELNYFRSGYGAEAEPIEITTNTDEDIENAFSKAKESKLTQEDVTVSYNDFEIGPDTSYQEIIDELGYPENFEVNNNGFISAEDEYRWQLVYPDQSDYEFEVRIVCASSSMDPEGSDSYVDFVKFSCPTCRGISEKDSVYSLVETYGTPDDITEASWQGYTDVVYEFEGNKLIFTIGRDNTITAINIDFA